MVYVGWGVLLTAGAPKALSRRLGLPVTLLPNCPTFPPHPQDAPGPSPVPVPSSLIYALVRVLQEASAGAAGRGGGRRGVCIRLLVHVG